MEEFKGHLGNWRYEFNRFSSISPNGETIIKVDKVGTPIAILPMPIGGKNTKEKNEADAKLMVSSLLMLQTLQEIVKCKGFDEFINNYPELAKKTSKAIDKALK